MKSNRWFIFVLVTLFVITNTVLDVIWLEGKSSLSGNWLAIFCMTSRCLIVSATVAGILFAWHTRTKTTIRYYADVLCDLDVDELEKGSISQMFPMLSDGDPMRASLMRVRDRLVEYGRKLQDAEHERAKVEVRCKRITDERNQLSEILDNLADPVVAIDQYDEVVLANHRARDLFNISGESEERALANLVECEELVDLLTGTRERHSTVQRVSEFDFPNDGTNERSYRITCQSMGEGAETTHDNSGAVAVLNDISDRKAIQKRNAEFVSSVSHEMKTPLAGIKAYVELLADGDAEDEETREEFLEVINGQADRLQRLIDNLLNLARIEAGVVKVDKQPRSLNELLEEAVDVVQPAAEQKGIKLTSQLSKLYLGVLADRDMLLQSAINLLSNAVKYTDPGGEVTLRSRLEDNDVVFEIQDTGVGLSDEDCEKVFSKFYRVKKDKNMASGTGLGLPLAKHLVEDVHGGELTLTSQLGVGSTFAVRMPCVKNMNNQK